MCLTSASEMVLLSEGIKEPFVIRLLTIPWGLKKMVICICDFGLCSVPVVWKLRFLVGGHGGPIAIAVWGVLRVKALTRMLHRFCGIR